MNSNWKSASATSRCFVPSFSSISYHSNLLFYPSTIHLHFLFLIPSLHLLPPSSPSLHPIYSCPAMDHSFITVSCPVLSCPVLSCPVLPCPRSSRSSVSNNAIRLWVGLRKSKALSVWARWTRRRTRSQTLRYRCCWWSCRPLYRVPVITPSLRRSSSGGLEAAHRLDRFSLLPCTPDSSS